jgi:tellurite resistance protein
MQQPALLAAPAASVERSWLRMGHAFYRRYNGDETGFHRWEDYTRSLYPDLLMRCLTEWQKFTMDMSLEEAPNLLERVHAFNVIGQTAPPNGFNADRLCFYTGMQLEELAEKIAAIADGAVEEYERNMLKMLAGRMQDEGMKFKNGTHMGAVMRANREDLLDADIDVLVVSAGALIYQTKQWRPAVGHVLEKNDAKFQMIDGKLTAVRDANGKIQKPQGWTPPDLSPFVELPDQD